MLLARDIMTTSVITVRKNESIFKAAAMLVDHRITGLPVVDGEDLLVGILSEYDVLRILKETLPDQNKTVADFMTSRVVSFEETTPVVTIWEFFIQNPTKRRVPIVFNGKLVGLLSRGDIVRQIVKTTRK